MMMELLLMKYKKMIKLVKMENKKRLLPMMTNQ